MTHENVSIFNRPFEEKIAHLQVNFGTNSPIVRAYERLHELAGENPSLDTFEKALTQVEYEVEEGKFKSQS